MKKRKQSFFFSYGSDVMPFTSYPVALIAVFNFALSTGPSEMITVSPLLWEDVTLSTWKAFSHCIIYVRFTHTAHHAVYFYSCFDHVVILHFCYYNAVKSMICHYKLELTNRNYSICFFLFTISVSFNCN